MSFTIDLSGRRALVTGAGRHTGRLFAHALADAGAEVAVNDIVAEQAKAVCEEIRGNAGAASPLVFDVSRYEQVQDAVGEWAPDILVNNVGGTHAIGDRKWGRVITIISDASRRGEPGMAVYGAAKAGAAGFIRSIAVEVGRFGITANCISFGSLAYATETEEPDEERLRRMLRNYAVKRRGQPNDPVGLLLLLASDHASWITGQVIPVNGGYVSAL